MKKEPSKSLVFSDDKRDLIKLARQKGLTDEQIVLKLTQGHTYLDCRTMAPVWAKEIGITASEFMVLARRRR